MDNAVLFVNAFLSYLLLFAVIVVLAIAAIMLGKALRKRKDAKDAAIGEIVEKMNGREE